MSREQINQSIRDNNDRKAQLELIQEACVKANPEIRTQEPIPCPEGRMGCAVYHCRYVTRSIHLADVLLAIRAAEWNPDISINKDGRLHIFILNRGTAYWDLRRDYLTEQSEDCIKYLYETLK